MEQENIMNRLAECAYLLYQNREQEAYERLQGLLGELNQILQYVAKQDAQKAGGLMQVFKAFIEAYQVNDNLALADLLAVEIPNELAKIV